MSGLFGYSSGQKEVNHTDTLLKMQKLLTYDRIIADPFYNDESIHAGNCYASFDTIQEHVSRIDNVFCWLEGEFYNKNEIRQHDLILPDTKFDSDPEFLLHAYRSSTFHNILEELDGYFSAVIYDKGKKKLFLMTDRFGFRHTYIYKRGSLFAWASEAKAFTALPGWQCVIDMRSVGEFFTCGMLCENRTWMEDVSVLPPATLLELDIRSGNITSLCYWKKESIKKLTSETFNFGDYYEEWGRLFIQAVEKRCLPHENTGITLSGGLDSRALLAAIPEGKRINAVTLGSHNCHDVRFAKKAAQIKGATHFVYPLQPESWFESSILGIWATDGSLCLSNQLGIEHLKSIGECFSVSLNGIGGGRMQGGFAVGESYHHEDDVLNEHGEPGLQMIRRRMLRQGFRLDESYYKIRMPFFDNKLYELTMSVPGEIRQKGIIYIGALMHTFPQYYKSIPWQQAGVPISWPKKLLDMAAYVNRINSKGRRILQKAGIRVPDNKLYFCPENWLRSEPARSFITNLLENKNALYQQYRNRDVVLNNWKFHLAGKTVTEAISRDVTFEIWLQQIFEKKYRPFDM